MKGPLKAALPMAALIVLGAGSVPYRVGDRVEDFSLPTLDGKSARLSDYRGKVVLLAFFATW